MKVNDEMSKKLDIHQLRNEVLNKKNTTKRQTHTHLSNVLYKFTIKQSLQSMRGEHGFLAYEEVSYLLFYDLVVKHKNWLKRDQS